MGNDITLHRGRRPTNIDLQERLLSISKQSKKSKASKIASRQCTPRPPRRRLPQLSIDLDLTNDDMLDSPVCAPNEIISWNCHHSLKMIGSDLVKLRYKLNRWKSTGTNSVSQQQRVDLSSDLDDIRNTITSTIHGITHNYLSGKPNERALLDYWTKHRNNRNTKTSRNSPHEMSVIVFEIAGMEQIHQRLGWKSGDNIIIETGKKVQEYCDWYTNDYAERFKLFHPDFALNEFIVVTLCTDDRLIADFCEVVLSDVARSVKCFFQETTVWAGYTTNPKEDMDEVDELPDIRYDFLSRYERSKSAINDAMKIPYDLYFLFSDRIRKWLSPQKRLDKGRKIMNLIHSYRRSLSEHKKMEMDLLIHHIEKEMKSGADLDFSDRSENTPFFHAISLKNEQLIRFLLQYEFSMDHRNALGQTALAVAMKCGITESMCCVMAHRVQYPNIPDNANMTAFVWALNVGYFKVMDILRDKGATDYRSWVQQCCMANQDVAVCDVIRDHGIIFSSKLDPVGRSLLHYAVLHKAMNVINMVLQNRYVHPDIVDEHNWTPLHYAAAKNNWEIVQILIGYDAAMKVKTDDGLTPLDVARKYQSHDVVMMLEEYDRERSRCSTVSVSGSGSGSRSSSVSVSGSGHSHYGQSMGCTSPSGTNCKSSRTMTVGIRGRTNTISISMDSNSNNTSTSSYEDDDGYYEDEIGWNKENEDINVMHSGNQCDERRPTASASAAAAAVDGGALSKQRYSASESTSKTQSQSENVNKSRWRGPKLSLLEEREFVKRLDDLDCDPDQYSDSDDSNQTRIIHSSFDSSGSFAASITGTPRAERYCSKKQSETDNIMDSESDSCSDGLSNFVLNQIERGIFGGVQ